jgi:hypothetical protein
VARPKDVRGKPAVLTSLVAHSVALVAVTRGAIVRAGERPAEVEPAPIARAVARIANAAGDEIVVEPIAIALFDVSRAESRVASREIASPGVRREVTRLEVASPGVANPQPSDLRCTGAATAASRTGDAAITASTAAAAGGADAAPDRRSGGGTGHSWMKMRGAELGLDGAFVERFVRESPPLPTVRKSGRVEPAGGGTGVIHDRVTTVTIDRDGKAHLRDKPDLEVHWDIHLPTPGEIQRELRQAGRDIARWYEDPYRLARVGPSQDVPRHMSATPGACDRWGDECSRELRVRDEPESADRADSVAHGKLDVTAWLMRKLVGDPYASRKRALLDGSFEERADAGARHVREDLARSAELMQRNLDALWRTTSAPVARRQALFQLWDECGEGEGLVGDAAERARRMVIGWIRAKLPPGSPDAFTAAEVARLNAQRSSRQPFVPYE